ncbi:MAG: FtsQ-type POTRA domain-containing protein, partial [Clostridiales bacterium]|nr:FtsQ-type POTRA domain-containing protein [Clostridiales bacterium]
MSDNSNYKKKNEEFSDAELSDIEKPRPKGKKPRKKKRRRKFYFLRFLLFCLACFLIYKGMDSSYFTVKNFKVSGNMFYTPAQIIDMSGLKTGVNLFFETKTRPARDKLLEDPYIKLADIRRRMPDIIEINITERLEYAA